MNNISVKLIPDFRNPFSNHIKMIKRNWT